MHHIGRAAAAARDRRSPGRHRRRERAWLVAALAGFALAPGVARAQEEKKLDLPTALELGRRNNPAFEAARRRVEEARGELTGASAILRENPEVDVAYGRRRLGPGAEGNRLALDAGIAQRLEVAGQRGKRVERASAELSATEADVGAARRALELSIATGFYEALGAAERAKVASEHEGLARELLAIAGAREARGAISPLEANGARVRLAEASRQRLGTLADEESAAVRLAALLGLDPATRVVLQGGFPEPRALPADELRAAAARRPEVQAAQQRTRAARAAAALASRSAVPDVSLGARYQVEEAGKTWLATVAAPIPLFQNGQGERAKTVAAEARAEAEERAVRTQAAAEAEEARLALERAELSLALYDSDVLRALRENLALLRRMLEAGKVAPAEVILLQRELNEARLGYVAARVEHAVALARARVAAGLPILDDSHGGGR